ncbi:MAG TPA: glycosyltransferase family 4 protein [Pyrinomonadaceae bacterium]|jgi:glycosyltransferase involved in cell wall biosynthesis
MFDWHILTGEYPPQSGGVGDYTRLLARELAQAGDSVYIWAPASLEPTPADTRVEVRRLPGRFGLRALMALHKGLKRSAHPRRILVQYVPQAFGWPVLNIPFCLWLLSRRRETVWVMFHEVYFPMGRKQSLALNAVGAITRFMAVLVARAAARMFVSIPAWAQLLKPLVAKDAEIVWLPIPSNINVHEDSAGVEEIRARYAPGENGYVIGHFGTYGKRIVEQLKTALPALLLEHPERVALLLGRGGEALRDELVCAYPELGGRLHATGALSADDVSRHLKACDLLIQPFIDGVSSRRTSLMAGLAHGLPIVTTTGSLTESLWSESRAVILAEAGDTDGMVSAAERILSDAAERERLAAAARRLYQERFDVSHTISALREDVRQHEYSPVVVCKTA